MTYVSRAVAGIRYSRLLRLCLVGTLALLLLVPIVMIYGLVWERQTRHEAVTAEVASSWGTCRL